MRHYNGEGERVRGRGMNVLKEDQTLELEGVELGAGCLRDQVLDVDDIGPGWEVTGVAKGGEHGKEILVWLKPMPALAMVRRRRWRGGSWGQ